MHIEHEIKLNYDDVLIRPKRSTLGSRKEVDLERGFNFPNYQPKPANNPDLLPKGYPAGPYPEEKHYRNLDPWPWVEDPRFLQESIRKRIQESGSEIPKATL